MKFSWSACIAIVATVMVSGAISLVQGTFTSQKVTMGFLNHGGMWGDLLIMPIVAGLLVPHLVRKPFLIAAGLAAAAAVSLVAHVQWAKEMRIHGITGHMFPDHRTGLWYADMSAAGWMHVLVMAALLAVLFLYAFSPVPMNAILAISLLLTAHVFLGTVEPGWYCTGKLWTWENFGPPLLATLLIWGVAVVKL